MLFDFNHDMMDINQLAANGQLFEWRLGQNFLKSVVVLDKLCQSCLMDKTKRNNSERSSTPTASPEGGQLWPSISSEVRKSSFHCTSLAILRRPT